MYSLRTTQLILAVLWAICLLCSVNTPVQARTLDEIKASGEIRYCVAVYGDVIGTVKPPGCRGDDCQFEGLVYQLTQLFTKAIDDNLKATYRIIDWDEQFQNQDGKTVREDSYTPALLVSGTCDIYPSFIAKVDWRLTKMDLLPFFPVRNTIIVRKSDKKKINKLEHLAGKTAGVMQSSFQHTWVEEQNKTVYQNKPIQVKIYPRISETLEAIETGEVDFAILTTEDALWEINNRMKKSALAFIYGDEDHIHWGFQKEDKTLQSAAKTFFDRQMKAKYSELSQLWKKTFGVTAQEYLQLLRTMK